MLFAKSVWKYKSSWFLFVVSQRVLVGTDIILNHAYERSIAITTLYHTKKPMNIISRIETDQ
jgi:hypothetical protein